VLALNLGVPQLTPDATPREAWRGIRCKSALVVFPRARACLPEGWAFRYYRSLGLPSITHRAICRRMLFVSYASLVDIDTNAPHLLLDHYDFIRTIAEHRAEHIDSARRIADLHIAAVGMAIDMFDEADTSGGAKAIACKNIISVQLCP